MCMYRTVLELGKNRGRDEVSGTFRRGMVFEKEYISRTRYIFLQKF